METFFDFSMIAPCGINCGTCYAFQRTKNRCVGCLTPEGNKPKHCNLCSIKNCGHLPQNGSNHCYECEIFPCKRLKQLDKRYRSKYHSSLIQNLKDLKVMGEELYMEREKVRCRCKECGAVICIHAKECQSCKTTLPEFI